MTFSGAVTLTDLNDFITPSQACIKPVEVKKTSIPESNGVALTDIRVDNAGAYYEVDIGPNPTGAPSQKLVKAEISLNDCLACSGCITSAESVLITMQSHEEVLSFFQSNPPPGDPDYKVAVLSISPQSLASLNAVFCSKSPSGALSMRGMLDSIKAFASMELGFDHVFDTTFARHMALQEHVIEYEERSAASGDKSSLPMLASACPGWICYAEKTHTEMLPFISKTKSPQQVMGTLIKEWLGRKLGKSPDQMYHVTVMPCYDKKLEASRQDFYNDQYRTRDVDCVITTGELETLMRSKKWDIDRQVKAPGLETFGIPDLFMPPGSSSGGWLQAIINHVIEREKHRGRTCNVRTKIIRTSDYEDVVVEAVDQADQTEVVFRGAKCYGFRNLQNVVRKVAKEAGVKGAGPAGTRATRGRISGATAALRARRARAGEEGVAQNQLGDDRPYDYVEVMACPAGCVNGGGQARRPVEDGESGDVNPVNGDTAGMGSRWGDREWVKTVEQTYWGVDQQDTLSEQVNALAELVIQELGASPGSTKRADAHRTAALRTQYHEVKSEVIGLNVKW